MTGIQAAHIMRERGRFVSLSENQVHDASLEDYIPIDLKNILPDRPVAFSLYYPVYTASKKELTFSTIAGEGEVFKREMWQFLAKRGIASVYAHKSSLTALTTYFEELTRSCIDSSETSLEEKTQSMYRHAEFLVETIFRDPEMGHIIGDASRWAGMVGEFFQKDPVTPAYLCRMFAKDYTTFTHSIQVSLLGMAFGTHLAWGVEEISDFGVGSLLHDLGKIWIDNHILKKPGTLTQNELSHVRRHPRLGHDHLRGISAVPPRALEIVLQHHENSDGSGYPLGLVEKEIAPLARVAHIVDCYDALTTKRPYKGPLTPYRALRLMHEGMRESFDSRFFSRFIDFLGK